MSELIKKRVPLSRFRNLKPVDEGADSFVYRDRSKAVKIYTREKPQFEIGAFNERSISIEQLDLYSETTNEASAFLEANKGRLPSCPDNVVINPVSRLGYHKGAGLLWSESQYIRGKGLRLNDPKSDEVMDTKVDPFVNTVNVLN